MHGTKGRKLTFTPPLRNAADERTDEDMDNAGAAIPNNARSAGNTKNGSAGIVSIGTGGDRSKAYYKAYNVGLSPTSVAIVFLLCTAGLWIGVGLATSPWRSIFFSCALGPVGALLRYYLSLLNQREHRWGDCLLVPAWFPIGTFGANVAACILGGAVNRAFLSYTNAWAVDGGSSSFFPSLFLSSFFFFLLSCFFFLVSCFFSLCASLSLSPAPQHSQHAWHTTTRSA